MIKNHSLSILGHRTSITLEEEFFTALKSIAVEKNMSLAALVAEVERNKPLTSGLSSALRVFILQHYQDKHSLQYR